MGLTEADFESIEAAVMETARGRWFLLEYARRCRAQDTGRILSAIDRLEGAASEARAGEARAKLNLERAAELVGMLVAAAQSGQGAPTALEDSSLSASPRTAPALPSDPLRSIAVKGVLDARLEALANLASHR